MGSTSSRNKGGKMDVEAKSRCYSSIHARWVATVEPDAPAVLEDQVITIEGGKITGIVPRTEFAGTPDVSLPTHILIPGLVNCHTHTPMALLRGYADDLPLQDWLFNHIFPTEGKFVMEASLEEAQSFVRFGSELAVYEMLKTGTTLFNDMYFHGDITADVVQKAGLRAVLGKMGLLYFGDDDMFADIVKANTEWAAEVVKAGTDRIYPSLIPHSAYMVPESKLQEAKAAYAAACPGLTYITHTHLHETKKEIDDVLEKAGKSAIDVFDELGMLDSNTVFAHCVHMTDEEIAVLASRKVNVSHNPRSNLKLGSGIAPVVKMLDAGVNVCLGTDGPASDNTLDMLTEMQYASFLAKGSTCDSTKVTALDTLRMATLNGAKALGLGEKTGSIKVGKAADLVAVDLGHLQAAPIYDPLSTLVYTNTREVTHVWVDGRTLVEDGKVLTLTLDMAKIQEMIAKIADFRKTLPGREKPVQGLPLSMCR
mmetsp:Transcript_103594/g.183757  ORF Transcript_103594/g.183757 Transcript_103594/m.183757 type:complete len:482 (-) Transcript_103594:126-1571(-)